MAEPRSRLTIALALLALLALFVALALLLGRGRAPDLTRDHSSISKNPWGLAACRELLERLHIPTRTWQRPLTELDDRVAVLMVLAPQTALGPDEQERLLQWVARGGRLVLAAFGEGVGPLSLMSTRGSALVGHLSMDELLHRLGLSLVAVEHLEGMGRPRAHSELTRNVRRVAVPSPYRLAQAQKAPGARGLAPHGEPRVDIAADGKPVLMTLHLGRGVVHVLSEVELLSNRCLGREDNALLAVNLALAAGAPNHVYFDEYHHPSGAQQRPGPKAAQRRVDPTPLYHVLAGLLATAVIYGLGRAQRFGAPVPAPPDRRPSATDYVQAFAALYCRAHARDAALAMLAQGLRRKMAHAAHAPPHLPAQGLGERLSARGLPGEKLAALLMELEHPPEPLTDAALVHLGRATAQYERML